MKKHIVPMAAVAVMAMAAVGCKADNKNTDTATVAEETDVASELGAVAAAETGVDIPEAAPVPAQVQFKDTTASGLKYNVLKEGTGRQPKATDMVKVHYTGKHLDGRVFDSSIERGEAISFPLNQVIPGWTEGLQLMKEGGVYEFYIPAAIAYGEKGTPGGPIDPNEDLYFLVQLIEVQ